MTALRIKSERRVPVCVHPHGNLQFIPVSVFAFAWHNGRNFRLYPADFAQRVFHFFPLELPLRFVVRVLQLTPAARIKHGALRLYPSFRGDNHLFYFTVAGIALDFQRLKRNFFARQRIRHEKNAPFRTDDALAVAPERLHFSR